MKKIIVSLFTLLSFSVFAAGFSRGSLADSLALNPPTRLDNVCFKQLCSASCIALAIYKLDAIRGDAKEKIIKEQGVVLINPDVRFDLQKINEERKGWTRHYPVTIENRQFIVRIFLTEEKMYQPSVPVLFEVTIKDPAVTCQVLLGINSIIESRKAGPLTSYLDVSAAGLSTATSL